MNKLILWIYDNIQRPVLHKFFNKVELCSLKLFINDRSVSLPLVSPEKLVFGDIKEKKVLDLGTGCGIIALCAKKKGAKYVIGTDINPKAVQNARENLKTNFKNTKNIKFEISNLFENINEKFDIIVSNPPFFNFAPTSVYAYQHSRRDIMKSILKNSRNHLYKCGEMRILFPASEAIAIRELSKKWGYKLNILPHNLHKGFKISLLRLVFQLIYKPNLNIYVFRAIKKIG